MRPARSARRPRCGPLVGGASNRRREDRRSSAATRSEELEAPDRGHVANRLMLPSRGCSRTTHRSSSACASAIEAEAPAIEQFPAHRLVQPLDLARGGRRVRGGQEVADPVAQADPVEGHGSGPVGEPAREGLAVVGQGLLGDAVALQRLDECVAHGPSRRSRDQLRAHAEARVIVDPGDRPCTRCRPRAGPHPSRPSARAPSAAIAPSACSRSRVAGVALAWRGSRRPERSSARGARPCPRECPRSSDR